MASAALRHEECDRTTKERLRKYHHVRYEADASSISVLPTSSEGFTVGLEVNQSRYTVAFNGWHEVFEKEDEALECSRLDCPMNVD